MITFKKLIFTSFGLSLTPILFSFRVSAHCPLCTMVAGVAAVGASMLGVNDQVIGIFLGAFATSLGLWIGRILTLKKKIIPRQIEVLTLIVFLTTIIPIMPFFEKYSSIYISYGGEYGSLLNRTYIFSNFIIGSIIGAGIMLIAPTISKCITALRNGAHIKFQTILVSLSLLLFVGFIFQFIIKL